jgi:hypothetical protein
LSLAGAAIKGLAVSNQRLERASRGLPFQFEIVADRETAHLTTRPYATMTSRLAVQLLLTASLAAVPGQAQPPTPRVSQAGGDVVIEYGPLDFPARTTHEQMLQPPTVTVRLPADGWLRGLDVELRDSAGAEVPRRLLHHMNVISPDSRDLFSNVMLRMGAVGVETAPIILPRVIGLRARKGDSLFITLMFENQSDVSYQHVTLRARMPFTARSSRIGAVSVFPISAAIGPKNQPNVFDLPPGRSEHYWEGSPAVAARILGLSGHLHRYGVQLRLEDRTAGKVLWEVTPKTDSSGEVLEIPVSKFVWSAGKPIRPDHVYRLTAVYENPTGQTISEGGMGVMGGLVMLRGDTQWPRVDREHADYLADLHSILMGHHM